MQRLPHLFLMERIVESSILIWSKLFFCLKVYLSILLLLMSQLLFLDELKTILMKTKANRKYRKECIRDALETAII